MEGGWFDSEAIEAEHLEADMEMAGLEAAARRAARIKKAGGCTHSWRQTFTGYNRALGPQNGPHGAVWAALAPGESLCLHCGGKVPKGGAQ